jgi:predicted dehydrogenase
MSTAEKTVRFGVIGVGTMGSAHVQWLLDKKAARAEITAICDTDSKKMENFPQLQRFTDSAKLIRSGAVDAVLIATPHYDHVSIGIDALKNGLHTLIEKPLAVHKADCQRLIDAYEKRPDKKQQFGVMFNLRTITHYSRLREMIRAGELGEIRRVTWIITECFRTEAYYASGGWRATWKGEGGGVLVNQCPHHLDLIQWLFGMPTVVRASCHFGKWHAIEVEDDVTAYLEFPNGATGVFIATTGEAPGTNRLEIAAERGKIVIENDKVMFYRNVQEMSEFSRTTSVRFGKPESWKIELPIPDTGGEHTRIVQNFTDAVLDGAPLLASGVEGIHSAELANAMILSSLLDQTVRLPIDAALYEQKLMGLIASSRATKTVKAAPAEDLAKSFSR